MDKWVVNSEDQNMRLLAFIKLKSGLPTKQIRYSIEHHGCRVNKRVERFCSTRLKTGDYIQFAFESKPVLDFDDKRILFEDKMLLAYNKPARISSEDLEKIVGATLVHRLDRDTSGILLFAKNPEMQTKLEELFKQRKIKKRYLAIVHGRTAFDKKNNESKLIKVRQQKGKVIWGVSDKTEALEAKTTFYTKQRGSQCCLLQCIPLTGRTHQIRAHLKALGHPIVGDLDYGDRKTCDASRPLLHAEKINFVHPETKKVLDLHCPLPEDFEKMIETLLK